MPAPPPAPTVGAWVVEGAVRFRVWAPDAEAVDLVLEGGPDDAGASRTETMARRVDGRWEQVLAEVEPGQRYRYRLDGGDALPDPSSFAQPEGVHGPSAVVDPAFAWTDAGFSPPPLERSVLYELHVGTFTPEGTFDAVVPHLDRLAELGVTTVELLPVAQFPGGRNWGYDGVFPSAAQDTYGGLEGLRRLVDAAHARGLAVCLDVVHNHLGPEGNVLGRYGPYFTDRYRTPWGDALNFDGAGADRVRELFVESARFWFHHAHVDAFRLDAVHAIVDATAWPYVEQLTGSLHQAAAESRRSVLVVAESASNDPRLVRAAEAGGWGLDAQWNDDLHHALHVALTGEGDGYYADFRGVADLPRAVEGGFVYRGEHSVSRGHRHGHPGPGIDPGRAVVFSANHDQVGNRLAGDRLSAQVDPARFRVAAAAVVLSPSIPLLFMGDEHAEPAPFPYFVSHTDPDLVEAVRRGRAEEFAAFAKGATPPDPQAEETFRSAVLDHQAARTGEHEVVWRFHQALLRLRRELRPQERGHLEALADPDAETLAVRWTGRPGQPDLALLVAFADGPSTLAVPPAPEGLTGAAPLTAGWTLALDSSDPAWAGSGPATPDPRHPLAWQVEGPTALLAVAPTRS